MDNFFCLFIYPELMPNVISTYPQLHSILHSFIKNCILLQQVHKISYFQSVCMTFLHTLLKFQLPKAKLYSQYTLKTVGTDFSHLGKPVSNEIRNTEQSIPKSKMFPYTRQCCFTDPYYV